MVSSIRWSAIGASRQSRCRHRSVRGGALARPHRYLDTLLVRTEACLPVDKSPEAVAAAEDRDQSHRSIQCCSGTAMKSNRQVVPRPDPMKNEISQTIHHFALA